MHAFSPADGFIAVKEGVDEMIKCLANEPSVGLYFVQHHAQASMPNLLSVKEKLADEVYEVTFHTEDIEDSICVVRSMTEFGLPIADDMIKDINHSLHTMSSSQPKRGMHTCRYRNWYGRRSNTGLRGESWGRMNLITGMYRMPKGDCKKN